LDAIQAPSLWHHPHHGAENQRKTYLPSFFASLRAARKGGSASGAGAWCFARNAANFLGSIVAGSSPASLAVSVEDGEVRQSAGSRLRAVGGSDVQVLVEAADVDGDQLVLVREELRRRDFRRPLHLRELRAPFVVVRAPVDEDANVAFLGAGNGGSDLRLGVGGLVVDLARRLWRAAHGRRGRVLRRRLLRRRRREAAHRQDERQEMKNHLMLPRLGLRLAWARPTVAESTTGVGTDYAHGSKSMTILSSACRDRRDHIRVIANRAGL
jgi:hypothetical protein